EEIHNCLPRLNNWAQERFIAELAGQVSNDQLPALLSFMDQLSPSALPDFLSAAASRLAPEFLAKALDLISRAPEPYLRAKGIIEVARWLPVSFHSQAIEIVDALHVELWRSRAFAALLPHLSESNRLRVLRSMLNDALANHNVLTF